MTRSEEILVFGASYLARVFHNHYTTVVVAYDNTSAPLVITAMIARLAIANPDTILRL
ncbi:hypothetical protein N9O28_00740 [Emcibacteraceae bacterium]|nr:hypothetical protein [Emcibacteraceae bacterium]